MWFAALKMKFPVYRAVSTSLTFLFLISINGCLEPGKQTSDQTSKNDSKPLLASQLRAYLHADSGTVKQLHGMTFKAIKNKLGAPVTNQDLFPNKVGLLEYQIEIYNWIDQKDKQLIVKETCWQAPREGSKPGVILYVWYRKKNKDWISFHSLVHDERVEF